MCAHRALAEACATQLAHEALPFAPIHSNIDPDSLFACIGACIGAPPPGDANNDDEAIRPAVAATTGATGDCHVSALAIMRWCPCIVSGEALNAASPGVSPSTGSLMRRTRVTRVVNTHKSVPDHDAQ